MRKLLFLVLLLEMVMLNEKGKPIGNTVESKNVFILNYGEGKDIK